MSVSVFRGHHAISKVVAKLKVMKAATTFSPHVKVLRLYRVEYDLVRRWPRAAAFQGFEVMNDALFFEGLLILSDASRPRYDPAKLDWEVRGNS